MKIYKKIKLITICYLISVLLQRYLKASLTMDLDFDFDEENPSEQCIGKFPIPFENNRQVYRKDFTPIVFNDFEKLPDATTLENNAHNVIIKMKYVNITPTIKMGPLEEIGIFRFENIYFHWLENVPVQYAYENIEFPAEMHVLFYDEKYGNINEAKRHKNSIVILAFGLKINPSPSQKFDGLQQNLKHIKSAYESIKIESQALNDWMPTELISYIVYNGSFQYNDCGIEVLWIDFYKPIVITPDLVKEFLPLQSLDQEPLMNQFELTTAPNDIIFAPNNLDTAQKNRHTVFFNVSISYEEILQGSSNVETPINLGVFIIFCILIFIVFPNFAY